MFGGTEYNYASHNSVTIIDAFSGAASNIHATMILVETTRTVEEYIAWR
jgi:hypothetical protein